MTPGDVAVEARSVLVPDAAVMQRHLSFLFGNMPDEFRDALFEVAWTDSSGAPNRARLFGLDQIDAAVALAMEVNAAGANIYFGAGLRRPGTARDRRAGDDDVLSSTCCWLDLDDGAAARALDGLTTDLPPTLKVRTGSIPDLRVQALWRFDVPLQDMAGLRLINVGLAAHLGGDPSVINPSRILRLAGGVAWPRKPGRVPELVIMRVMPGSTAHSSDALLNRFPPQPKPMASHASRTPAFTTPTAVNGHGRARAGSDPYAEAALAGELAALAGAAEGGRNHALNSSAFSLGQLVAAGRLDRGQVEGELRAAALATGLSGREVERTIQSGLGAGEREPRHDERVLEHRGGNGAAPPDDGPQQEPDLGVLRERHEPPPAFPVEVLAGPPGGVAPSWATWVEAAAEAAGAPIDYVAGALLAGAAALIGTSRSVSPWPGWTEPCVLWIGALGNSGVAKSPAMDPVLAPIRDLELELAEGFDEQHRTWQTRRATAKMTRESWEGDIKNAIKLGAVAPILPLGAVEPPEPVRPRTVVSDATIEALARLLAGEPRGVLFHRDELSGWLGNFDRYGGNGGDRSFWIEAYGGRPYVVDRVKTAGVPIRIEALAVSILGGIQPDRLQTMLLNGDDDGLPARFLWLWPDPIPPKRPDRTPDTTWARDALRRLRRLTTGGAGPDVVMLDEDAATEFQSWRVETYDPDITGMLGSAFAKAPGLVLRLALVLEHLWWAATPENPPLRSVGLAALRGAILLWEEYFRPQAVRVYSEASIPQRDRGATTLARWIKKTRVQVVNLRDIRRTAGLPGLSTSAAVAEAAEELVAAGWLIPAPAREGGSKGRQSLDFKVNPRLWEVL